MLTRFKVNGFKNLVDVDVRFGPFTCIAGANGAGKSNLFDAITFLSALADLSLVEAALSIRDEHGRTSDIDSIFYHAGDTFAREMSFEVEMIIPKEGVDDFGQHAAATSTFLRYTLVLARRGPAPNDGLANPLDSGQMIEILQEELTYIKLGDAKAHLSFPHQKPWRDSVIFSNRWGPAFISTEGEGIGRQIYLHQDKGTGGKARTFLAERLPRTGLSATTASESPTALLARNEMRSWRLLQLEPTALRSPDRFTDPARLGADGSHMPATLYHLAALDARENPPHDGRRVYAQVANRLAQLISDVRDISVERDERRELLTLYLRDRSGTAHPARALSDGTLRFLALATLEQDLDARGLICLEEPENGIHPERIAAMLHLLQALSVDPKEPVGEENPFRQVIVNTHSPTVVGQIERDDLVMVKLAYATQGGFISPRATFHPLANSWRAKAQPESAPVSSGEVATYLNPDPQDASESPGQTATVQRQASRRVKDEPEIRNQLRLWDVPSITHE